MTTPPDPLDLISGLAMNRRRINSTMRENLSDHSTMEVLFNVEPTNYSQIAVTSPFQAIPLAASGANFTGLDYYEAIAIHETTDPRAFELCENGHSNPPRSTKCNVCGVKIVPSLENFYDPKDQASGQGPAILSEMPTSTINPERPRTVAAGYDPTRQVLTVVFRDGTFWNYYLDDKSKSEANLMWQNFKRARSKGRWINAYFPKGSNYGPADVAQLSQIAREQLYRMARTGQIIRKGYTGKQKVGSRRGTGYGSKPITSTSQPTGKRGGSSYGGGTGRRRGSV